MLKIPNYGAARPSVDPADFLPEQLGLASIDFSFPPDTRFPCLPIATPRGLIFPLKGRTCACSPEIFLARQLGADITIRQGVIVPWLNDRKPFAEVISAIQNKRNSLPRDSLEYAMWKEMGNSIYGKLAQGIHRKPVFDTRSETHKTMPPSKISNPYLAAWITSMLRAVLCEILSGIPANRTVVSATTDGFICDAPEEEIIQATQGHLCRLLSRARNNLIGNPDILEVKHGASMLLAWRTRGQATVRGLSNKRIILARGGFQTKGLKEQEANDWLVNIFVERDTTLTNEVETIGSLHRIYLKGEDFKPEYLVRKVRMDYDWKRALVSHSVRPLSGIDLVSFSTRPWETVEDHMNCISLWETFRDRGGRVLKVEKDLTDFLEYKAARIRAQDAPHLVPRERPALTIALRQFLRAYVRDSWGLTKTFSYAELAQWLTGGDYKCSKSNVKDANRSNTALTEHCVPDTAEVRAFVAFIKETFPNFEAERMLERQIPFSPREGDKLPISLPTDSNLYEDHKQLEYLTGNSSAWLTLVMKTITYMTTSVTPTVGGHAGTKGTIAIPLTNSSVASPSSSSQLSIRKEDSSNP